MVLSIEDAEVLFDFAVGIIDDSISSLKDFNTKLLSVLIITGLTVTEILSDYVKVKALKSHDDVIEITVASHRPYLRVIHCNAREVVQAIEDLRLWKSYYFSLQQASHTAIIRIAGRLTGENTSVKELRTLTSTLFDSTE